MHSAVGVLINSFFLSTLDGLIHMQQVFFSLMTHTMNFILLSLHLLKVHYFSLNNLQLLSLILPTESTPPPLTKRQLRLLSHHDWALRYNISQVFVIPSSTAEGLDINTTDSTQLLTRTPNYYATVGAFSQLRHRLTTLRHARNAIATTTETSLRQNAEHLTSSTLVGETVEFFPFSPLFISHWVSFILRVFSLSLSRFLLLPIASYALSSSFLISFPISFLSWSDHLEIMTDKGELLSAVSLHD